MLFNVDIPHCKNPIAPEKKKTFVAQDRNL